MKRIAVFGKPGGGKSTLSKKLSAATGLELYPLDLIEYQENGKKVSPQQYKEAHNNLISQDSWIIEGLGSLDSFWSRIKAADTLIYVDLPYWQHYWLTTKRLLKSPVVKPEGWPEGSSVLKGTLTSWKYLGLSPMFWTSEFLDRVKAQATDKRVFHVRSLSELNNFIQKNVK